ncbi:MAG: hypothetical protein WCH58_04305 [Candidatus Saccharibacteria bacterium]|jgi:hypothetical protein
MKPEAPTPRLSPELPSVQYGPNLEHVPILNSPETGVEKSAERYEQSAETSAILSDIGLTTVIPAPVVNDTPVAQVTTISDNPMTANDDDLIEKEWVNKAKKIVAETRDNPHKREQAVNKLQIDYLKKRYGRELGAAE